MVDEAKFSAVLGDMARTLITDFSIQDILDHLVETIVGVLPITSAGITLIPDDGTGPWYVAASDSAALRFERLQSSLGSGPCLMAYTADMAVSVQDLAEEHRFPEFAPAALELGLGAVFTFPLRHEGERLGALDLYRDVAGELDERDLEVAQTLADVAAAYLLNADARERALARSDSFHHDAVHDPLTGLPNRLLFMERLAHASQRAKRLETGVAVMFMDLDRFKWVNDQHGHHAGDELLIAVARRFSTLLRGGDTLARFSGDEFVFLFEDVPCEAAVEAIAARIEAAFDEAFVIGDGDVTINLAASVGVAFTDVTGEISSRLVNQADTAMYEIKHARYDAQSQQPGRPIGPEYDGLFRRNGTEAEIDLRAEFADQAIDVAYQPIVCTDDGRIVGVEALLRWDHPISGPRGASDVIEIAERSRLIDRIGRWVLERSCRDRGRWLRDNPGVPLQLSVNVSGCQLVDSGFVATVDEVLGRTGMDPAALILELTESEFIDETGAKAEALAGLKQLGVGLAIDDFGTGYSSLGYLHRLPVDMVKIDGGLTADIDQSPTGLVIVTAIVDLAHKLGLTVTAEGIETVRQRDEIRAIGCDQAQGYLFARPAGATAIAALLRVPHTGYLPLRVPLRQGEPSAS